MTYEKAKEHLKDVIHSDGGLHSLGWYLDWQPRWPDRAVLDGEFNADDLEAISVYMRGPNANS